MFNQKTVDIFESHTGINVFDVFGDFMYFMENYHDLIVRYYSGYEKNPSVDAFKALDIVIEEIEKVIEQLVVNKDSFSTFEFWNLAEVFEDFRVNLMTVSNISKFLRSSIQKGDFSAYIETKYSLKDRETLESVSESVVNSSNPLNDWTEIALRNDMIEEDYDTKGGKLLSVVFDKTGGITDIRSVVDNINGKNMYGKDVYQRLTFSDNDLLTLSYDDTIKQAVDILVKLRKRDNPEFPNDGIQSNLVAGNNTTSIAYPVIFRQLFHVFSKDDTFASLSITNVRLSGDSLQLDATITTKYDEYIETQIKV